MSRTVDERVVSLQLDNKNLESNAKTSMSTLDKLKEKLNFKGLSKSADTLGGAVKKIDMSPLGRGVEAVHAKFSALEVIGVTALANITNSAVNAGKRIASALTIDPVKSGFQEYETQINAVQTILANTESKGTTLDDVNAALEELNKYADQTIYNFTEMTRNIGTFTAAGVDLETSTNAIKGIANLAAVSGSTSQQASTAMYQLSQALASGTVKLMDWNSVVNAGMGGQVFQDALKETARVHGVAIDSMIKEQGSFRETLSEGWLTSEILTETLQKFTLTTEGLTEEQIAANREMLKAKGYTDEQIDGIFKLGNTATNAATKVKTFTQLWDVMKESAQSGWAQTWKLIIGDFEQAKSLLTPLADFFVNALNKMSDARNKLLKSALGKTLTGALSSANAVLGRTKDAIDGALAPVKKVTGALEDLGAIADKVILGHFGDGKKRFDALTEAGENYYRVQNKVNEKLGNTFRYSDKQIEAQDKVIKSTNKATESAEKQADASIKLTKEDKERIKTMAAMSEEQFYAAGYTKEQAKALKELYNQADKLGIPFNEFIDNLDEIDGRWLLFNGLKNVGQGIVKVFKAMGEAWREVFPPATSDGLFNAIAGFHKFTSHLNISEKTADKWKRTFKGIFALLDIIIKVVATPLKIAFNILTEVLGYFGFSLLDVTAIIGDGLVWLNNWIDSTLDIARMLDRLMPFLKTTGKAIFDWFKGLKEADNIPKYIITGLLNGLKFGVVTVGELVWELGSKILTVLKKVLGIHSPSKETEKVGVNIVEGLVNGISGALKGLWDLISTIGTRLIEMFKGMTFGDILAGVLAGGVVVTLVKLGTALVNISKPFAEFSGVLDAFQGALKSFSLNLKAKALQAIAISIAILVGSVIALSFIDYGKLWSSVGAIAVLAIVLAGVAMALDKVLLSNLDPKKSKEFGKVGLMMISIAAAVFIMALALKSISKIKPEAFKQSVIGLATIVGLIAGVLVVFSLLNKFGGSIDTAGSVFVKMAGAMILLAIVVKLLGGMDEKKFDRGMNAMVSFTLLIGLFMLCTKLIGGKDKSIDALGKNISKIAMALLIMTLAAKIAGSMSIDELLKGGLAVVAFGGIIVGLMAATKLIGRNADKIGKTLLFAAIAIGILAGIAILLGFISVDKLVQGGIAVTVLGGIMAGLMVVSKYTGKSSMGSIIAITVAIGVLAAALVILSFIEMKKIITAGSVLSAVMGVFAILLKSAKSAKKATGTIITMTVAVAAIGGILFLLGQLPIDQSIGAAISLSLVMAAMTGVIYILGKISKEAKKAKDGAMMLVLLCVPALAFAGALLMMSGAKNAAKNAIGLTVLMVAMAGVIAILGKLNKTAKKALTGILALTLMAIPLIAFVGVLCVASKVKGAMDNALALTLLVVAMTLMLPVLALVGSLWVTAAIGIVALTAMVVPMLAFIGAIALMSLIDEARENAELLTGMMVTMAALLVILAPIAPLALAAVAALGALGLVMAEMAILTTAIGGIMDLFPVLEKFLDKGIVILEKLAGAIGSIVGKLIDGFLTSATEHLPELGTKLSQFMINLTPFITGMKFVDDDILKKIGIITAAILALTVANLLDGIATFLSFGHSFDELGTKLSNFIGNAQDAFTGLKGVDPKITEMIGTLASAILTLTGANIIQAITDFLHLTDGDGIDMFADGVPRLGEALQGFCDEAPSSDDIDVDHFKKCAEAIKILAEAAGAIPKVGGLGEIVVGKNGLKDFSSGIGEFADAIHKILDPEEGLGTLTEEQMTTVSNVTNIIKSLAEAAVEIPDSGGLVSWFAGDNDIKTFAEKFPEVATKIKEMLTNVGEGGFTETQINTVKAVADFVTMIAESAVEIPDSGGLISFIAGDNDLKDFADKFPAVGEGITKMLDKIGPLSFSDILTVQKVIQILDVLGSLGNRDYNNFVSTLEHTSVKLGTFAAHIAGFVTKLADITDGEKKRATEISSTARSIIDEFMTLDSHAVDLFAGSIQIVTTTIRQCIKDLAGEDAIKNIKASATDLMKAFTDQLSSSIDTKETGVKAIANKIAKAFANKLKSEDNIKKASEAGKAVAQGFANGISNNEKLAKDAGSSLGKAALKAAKEAIDSNSPSKEFYKVGGYAGIGFVNALYDYASVSEEAGGRLGRSSVDGLRAAIARIGDFVASDIDSQPTIRPVLDLSDVQAGANSIGGMFNRQTLSVNASNAGLVSSLMFGYQNGRNSDELTAQIKGLRKDLNNTPRNTYSVNGVTVEEGSSAASAIRALVNAMQVEGRA